MPSLVPPRCLRRGFAETAEGLDCLPVPQFGFAEVPFVKGYRSQLPKRHGHAAIVPERLGDRERRLVG
jgi:hypothetical protein